MNKSQSQIDYTKHSKKWYMPARYYSFVRGPVEFFQLDTNLDRMTDDDIKMQLHIMKKKLDKSKSKWKIVCGHHTWRSIAEHGNADDILEYFLTSLFKDTQPHFYMCGHDHCKSLFTKKGINLLIAGTGGEFYRGGIYLKNIKDSKLHYFSPSLGFAMVKATHKKLMVNFYGIKDNKIIEEFNFKI